MNCKHPHYFWRVAKAGGVAPASEQLHLTPQTISGQMGLLEPHLGVPLFARSGRNFELTDAGRSPSATRRTCSNWALNWRHPCGPTRRAVVRSTSGSALLMRFTRRSPIA